MRFFFLSCIIIFTRAMDACNQGLSQNANFPFSFHQIPITDPDLNKPGAGAEQWNDQNTVNIPLAAVNSPILDAYYRFTYTDIAVFSGTPGSYDFTLFDKKINDAISNKQKFTFRIMQICGGCSPFTVVEGAKL